MGALYPISVCSGNIKMAGSFIIYEESCVVTRRPSYDVVADRSARESSNAKTLAFLTQEFRAVFGQLRLE